MKKILLFIPRLAVAGAETMVQDLAIGLKNKGYNPIVVCFYEITSSITEKLDQAGISIVVIEKKVGFDISLYKKLYKFINAERPDVIHTHLNVDKYVVPTCKILGINKVFHTVHNIASLEQKKTDRYLTKAFVKLKWLTLVGISPEIKKSICDEYRLKSSRVPMIFNGRDLTDYLAKSSYTVENDIKILHIGRFSKQKNHEMLIDAFNDFLHECKGNLFLAGEGELQPEIQQKVQKLGLAERVIFLGLQSDVHKLMYSMDVFVLPSLYEGMPITLIEAMAVGMPIVATNVGGVQDMISDGKSGLLTNVDKNEIADALIRVACNRALRESIGRVAYLESKKYNMETMVNEYDKIYELI